MILFRKIPLNFEEKEYEIRVLYDDHLISVAAFLNNHPAEGYRYQVKIPNNCDAYKVLEDHGVEELVEACRKNLLEKRWESLSRVISSVVR
jgi:hypothetical protein